VLENRHKKQLNTSAEMASAQQARVDVMRPVREVLDALGVKGVSPTEDLAMVYAAWLKMGFSHEAVLRAAVDAIARADLLIVGGTSLTVYPAAGLLDEFRGDSLVVINRTPTAADRRADLLISEPIGEVLQSLMPHIPAPPREKSRP